MPTGVERSRICRKARDYILRQLGQQDLNHSPPLAIRGELTLTSLEAPPAAVLDTNVALDLLLFGERSAAALREAVTDGQLLWLATPAMRDELAHVLERGLAATRGVEAHAVLSAWDAATNLVPAAAPHRLQCTDRDDQKFVDLALACGARWLVSRDRAVLKLARRAQLLGVFIVTPERWRQA
jgi:predicted nucleic acid-binding protein